jgi:hypothetical protein
MHGRGCWLWRLILMWCITRPSVLFQMCSYDLVTTSPYIEREQLMPSMHNSIHSAANESWTYYAPVDLCGCSVALTKIF